MSTPLHALRVDGPGPLRLGSLDTRGNSGLSREAAEARTLELGHELSELEDLLCYAGTHALLVVLQGRDTSGKDGTIRKILEFSNAQSLRVEAFKVPTELEQSHDFLWRVHAKVPPRGGIAIFNRSHYEDVLVPRVRHWVPEAEIERRYRHIRHFESLIQDSGVILVKLFLNISKGEQEQRLLAREQETEKAWKLNLGDWKEREFWLDYEAAYQSAIQHCSTAEAPWHIVPSDRKWFRNLCVLEVVTTALRPHRAAWMQSLSELGKVQRAALEAYRATD